MTYQIPAHLQEQIARLSPEKQALLRRKLYAKKTLNDNKQSQLPHKFRTIAPLSFPQKYFWFRQQLEPKLTVYNVWTATRLQGLLNVPALERSITALVQRHEVLRTTFVMRDQQPIQVIKPSLPVVLNLVDLRHLSENQRWDTLVTEAVSETCFVFDLSSGPLFRTTLFQLDSHHFVLLWVFHHIVNDGWSEMVLYRELGTLYTTFTQQGSAPLANLPVQYADFSVWQNDWIQSDAYAAQLTYWKKQLAGIVPLSLSTDRPRSHKQTYPGAQHPVDISPTLCAALRTLSQRTRSSLFMVALTAFQTLLHRYTGQDDIVVSSPVAARNRPELSNLIGCFMNTLVLRNDCSGNPTFRNLLGRVRSTVLDALAHQEVPFEKLVKVLQLERDMSRTSLFQVILSYNNTVLDCDQFGTVQATPVKFASTLAQFDLMLRIKDRKTGLSAELSYNTDLFDASTIARMADHLQVLLAGIAQNPDQTIANLPLTATEPTNRLE